MRKLPHYLEPLAGLVDFNSFGELPDLMALVASSEKKSIIDALIETNDRLPSARDAGVGYDFVADANLSGLGTSCSAVRCRLARIREMCSFAALYTDQIVVRNPVQSCLLAINFKDLKLREFEISEVSGRFWH